MKSRKTLDSKDQVLVSVEVDKYPHPLEDNRPHLYNPVTGQIASTDLSVADSIVLGEKVEREFIARLLDGFCKAISSPIQTMCMLKRQSKIQDPNM